MKNYPFLRIVACMIISIFFISAHVNAEVDPAVISKSSSTLVKLELLKGDDTGNLKLDDKITRCEFVTLVIRLMGYDKNTDTDDISLTFTDLSERHWAYKNFKIAVKRNLIKGYDDNTVGADNFVTYTEAQAILIRALGYEGTMTGKWPVNVLTKAEELKLNKNVDVPQDKQLTRGEASVLIYNSLLVDFK
ncbi:MAG: S-layer homology domain-containing protein [Acetivibrionales bacterium]|jgi:hypothetical protein